MKLASSLPTARTEGRPGSQGLGENVSPLSIWTLGATREDASSHTVPPELLSLYSCRPGRDWLASAGKTRSRGFGAAPESAAGLPRAQAASNVGEGVGLGLQRLAKPCGDLGGPRKEGEGLASGTLQDPAAKGPGRGVRCEPRPWAPAAFLFSLSAERPREDARKKTGRKGGKRGARWRARQSSKNHSILSGDFREFLALTPSALNHVRQKCEAEKACRLESSAPISRR